MCIDIELLTDFKLSNLKDQIMFSGISLILKAIMWTILVINWQMSDITYA